MTLRQTEVIVDLNNNKYQAFKYMQFDDGCQLKLVLHEHNISSFLAPFTATALFQTESNIVYRRSCVIEDGNNILINIDKDITYEKGRVALEVMLSNEIQTITTFTMYFEVVESISGKGNVEGTGNSIVSPLQWETLQKLLDESDYVKKDYIDDALKDLDGYATEEYVKNQIAQAQLDDKDVDLSGFVSKEELEDILENVDVDLEGYATEEYVEEGLKEKADTIHIHDIADISYTNELHPNIKSLADAMDELLYVPPSILYFMSSKGATIYEIGTVIEAPIVFTWEYNKAIVSQSLSHCNVSNPSVRSIAYTSNISSDKSFILTGNDGKNTTSNVLSFEFRHKVFWGASPIPTEYNSKFILSFRDNEFAVNRFKTDLELTIGVNNYFYYCYPSSWGEAVFNVGGFDGGVSLVATVQFTNESGYTTPYYVYRSDNPNIGKLNFIVK